MTLNISSFFKMVMVTDFPLSVTLTFNASQATSGAQQAAQVFTDLATKMQSMGQSIGTLNTSFGTINQSTSQASQSVGTFSGALTSMNQSATTVKSSIDQDKTSLDAIKTGLDQTNTSLDQTRTAFDTANTTLETTNTTLGSVTTAIQTQDPELVDLTTKMTEYTTAGTEAVTAMQNELTAMQQLSPTVKDITGTLGETNTVTKDLTPSLERMTTDIQSMGGPLNNLNTELQTHNTESTTANTNTTNWSQNMLTMATSATSLVTGVISLARGIRDYNDGQIRVTATEKKVLDTQEKLEKAQRVYNDAVAKFGENSDRAKQALTDLTEAHKGAEVAVQRNQEAHEAFADSQIGIVTGSISTVIGLIGTLAGGFGNYHAMLGKVVPAIKTAGEAFGTLGTKMGLVTTATTGFGGALGTISPLAETTKVSIAALGVTIASTIAIMTELIILAEQIPKMIENIKNYQISQDTSKSGYERAKADAARRTDAASMLELPKGEDFSKNLIGALGQSGASLVSNAVSGFQDLVGGKAGGTNAELRKQEAIDAQNLVKAYDELAAERHIDASAVDEHSAKLRAQQIAMRDSIGGIKVFTTENSIAAGGLKAGKNDMDLYDAAIQQWGNHLTQTQSPLEDHSNGLQDAINKTLAANNAVDENTRKQQENALGVSKVNEVLAGHNKYILNANESSNTFSDSLLKQRAAFQGEEQSLGLLADKYGILTDQMTSLILNDKDNVAVIEELIAANLDYTSGLTDVEEHTRLVADGHLAGAQALKTLVDDTIKSSAANDTYTTGLQKIVDTSGGLPPSLQRIAEETDTVTQTNELWVKTLLGNDDALKELNKTIQDDAVQALSDLSAKYTEVINTFAKGGDSLKELKKQLKEILPKDLFQEVKMKFELKADEQNLKDQLDLLYSTTFVPLWDKTTQSVKLGFDPNIELKPDSGIKLAEKWQGNLSDAFETSKGKWSSKTAEQINSVLDTAITAAKADPAHANQIIADAFNTIRNLSPQLAQSMQFLTDDALKSFGVSPDALSKAKETLGLAGTQGGIGYSEQLVAALQKAGVPPDVIANIKKSFDPTVQNAATSGTDTANAFNTSLQSSLILGQAQLDITQTVFSTMIKAATLTAQGIADIFAAKNETIVANEGAMVEGIVTLYGTWIEQVAKALATTEGSFTAYEATVVGTEEALIQALVTLYTETLYGSGIGAMLVAAAGSFTDYETAVIESEGGLIVSITELYGTLLEQIAVGLAAQIEAFGTYEAAVLSTEASLIQGLVELYTKTLYGSGIGPTLVAAAASFKDYETAITTSESEAIASILESYISLTKGVTKELANITKEFGTFEKDTTTSQSQMVVDILESYKSMTKGVKTELDAIGKAFDAGAKKWEETTKDAVDKMIEEFAKMVDAVKDVVSKVNTELGKIKTEIVIHVSYKVDKKPSGISGSGATGLDFVTERGQPQLILVGEGATRERVHVSREGEPGFSGAGGGTGGGGGTVVVNDTINVYTSEGSYLGSVKTKRIFRNLESH